MIKLIAYKNKAPRGREIPKKDPLLYYSSNMKHVVGLFLLNILQDVKCCEKNIQSPPDFSFCVYCILNWPTRPVGNSIQSGKSYKTNFYDSGTPKILSERHYLKMEKTTFWPSKICPRAQHQLQ